MPSKRASERAIIVHIDFSADSWHEELEEFRELVLSAGVEPVAVITGKRHTPAVKYFIGIGKAREIEAMVQATQADVVLFNHVLSPAQERNLERLLKCRVLDRIGVILDIFAQRARTFEGKLQVELAQLSHLSTRLIRGWTHLERQKGGIGLRGGPGETQLEVDRRLIRQRVQYITKRLEKVRSQRNQGRRARRKADMPTISLVGYTNAGKSTLFNCLTKAEVYTADKLFATLDPTLRQIHIPHYGAAILVDTVGFIRHLPHELVEAFRATLEETQQADLLIHVQDIVNPSYHANAEQVQTVLSELNAEKIPQIQVFNKIDKVEGLMPGVKRNKHNVADRVWLSAKTGEGMDSLWQAIAEVLAGEIVHKIVRLKPEDGKLRGYLYEMSCVLDEQTTESGESFLSIRLPRREYDRLFH